VKSVTALPVVDLAVSAGRLREGGSTISQQLAKTSFLSPARTPAISMPRVAIAVWRAKLVRTRASKFASFGSKFAIGGGRLLGYLPFHCGVRLLRKASIPSRKSSLM